MRTLGPEALGFGSWFITWGPWRRQVRSLSLCLHSSKMGRCPGLPCCVSTRGTSHSLVCVDRAPWRCVGTEGKGSREPGHRRLSEGCWLSLPSLPRTLGGSSEVSILSGSFWVLLYPNSTTQLLLEEQRPGPSHPAVLGKGHLL